MPLVLADRVKDTTTTAGTGTVTLSGTAPSGFQSFSAIGNANTTYYSLTSGSAWEVGIGTYTAAGTTFSRDTVLSSSAAGAKITLSGTSDIFATYPSGKTVIQDGASILAGSAALPVTNGGTGSTTAPAALTALGAYPATNPSGYTTNVGTVTSVSGTGTVSGLSLTGSVTTSGSLTLGGTLSLTSGNVTTALGYTPYNATNPSGYITASSLSAYLPLTGGTLTGGLNVTSGNVGIGTSSPTEKLTVGGAGGPTTTPTAIQMDGTYTSADQWDRLKFYMLKSGTESYGLGLGSAADLQYWAGGTGNGQHRFFTSRTERFRIDANGGITSSNLADAVGYKGVPQNSQTAAYTLALSDMGKHISITTGGVVIPANASIAFPIGSTIVIFNNSAASQNISITTDTLRLAGTATTGTRVLAQFGVATCIKVTATVWVVTGNVT